MLEVAAGRGTLEEFAALLRGRPRSQAGRTAPAHGLALASVSYAGNRLRGRRGYNGPVTARAEAAPMLGTTAMINVLLTNDDGIEAEGLQAMRRALTLIDDVRLAVIAPDGNRSAMARSITTRRPLWVTEVPFSDGTAATRPTERPSTACASRASG